MTTATVQSLDAKTSVTSAISDAAAATGIDFRYLLDTAARESSLNPQAKSTSSSATGLFQFIDQTWLSTLKAHGADHGLAAQAGQISQDASGKLTVTDPAEKQAILALRKDPRISALMAGEYTRDSRNALQSALGRPVDGGELYMAHFLGAHEAAKFLSAADTTPTATAATSFPEAASANRGVFFDGQGKARSFAEVKTFLTRAATPPSEDAPPAPSMPDMASVIPQLRLPSFSDTSSDDRDSGSTSMMSANAAPGFVPSAPSLMTSALRLTPQILEILSSLDPLGASSGDEKANPVSAAFKAAGV